jgi:hypothetical protein
MSLNKNNKIKFRNLVISAILIISLQLVNGQVGTFRAEGNTDPVRKGAILKVGEVKAYFGVPGDSVYLSFNLPASVNLMLAPNIGYFNSYCETYDINYTGGATGSMEVKEDEDNNYYARMWIESQNPARIVVRWRGALCDWLGNIAHTKDPQGRPTQVVSPYGAGDWMDEWYYITPDGTFIRKVKIYTVYATPSKPFGFDRDPPNYVHEFQEIGFAGTDGGVTGFDANLAIDENRTFTLFKMDGTSKDIDYTPYPATYGSDESVFYHAFDPFDNANIFLINMKASATRYSPFVIGKDDNTQISPYSPDQPTSEWGDNHFQEFGKTDVALGHIVNWNHWEKTSTTITQVYLNGFTSTFAPGEIIVPLARSWLQAPTMTKVNSIPATVLPFDKDQRVYLVDYAPVNQAQEGIFRLNASISSPVVNPTIIINNWGNVIPEIKINNTLVTDTTAIRYGFQATYDMQANGTWNSVLVIWLKKTSASNLDISISPSGSTQIYNLTTSAINGSVSPSGGTYYKGTQLTLKAIPDSGYTFVNWSGDTTSPNNPVIIPVSSNKSVIANFIEKPKYNLITTAINGSVTPSVGTFYDGTVVELTAIPDEGFKFINWSGDIASTNNPVSVTFNSNKSVTANFSHRAVGDCEGLQNADYLGAGNSMGVTVTTNSDDDEAMGIQTVNGSGLTGGKTHDASWAAGWLSPEVTGAWITFDFGDVYPLGQIHYWNSNESGYTNRGVNSVTIEYSTDGSNFFNAGTYTFEKASGLANYVGSDGPDLSGISAKYIKFNINSSHGSAWGVGLAEIKFELNCLESVIEGKLFKESAVKVFPNPAANSINIQFEKAFGNVSLSISDISGIKFHDQSVIINSNQVLNIPLNVKSGIYIIRINHNAGNEYIKFVKN